MDIVIKITLNDVFADVVVLSGYIGAKAPTKDPSQVAGGYDRFALLDADKESYLSVAFRHGYIDVLVASGGFVSSSSCSDTVISLTYDMPSTWKYDIGALESAVLQYISINVLHEWLMLCGFADLTKYELLKKKVTDDFVAVLGRRDKPSIAEENHTSGDIGSDKLWQNQALDVITSE